MNNATRILISTMGTITGIAGIEHGIGEILQGNKAPDSVMILSWPESALFRSVGGEPAMTIVPNLLITGILAILFSSIFLLLATLFIQRKNAGIVLILLSIVMLLVGGGIFPPALGILVGLAATRIKAPPTRWRAHLPAGLQDFFVKLWPWSFSACIVSWLLLFPGSILLDYFFNISILGLMYMLILSAFGLLLLTIFSGFAYDTKVTTIE